MRRENFVPTQNIQGFVVIISKHLMTTHFLPFSPKLLKPPVPSVFDFPSHLQKVISERRPLKRKVVEHDDDTSPLTPSTSKSIKLSPSKEELKSIIQKQNKEVKTLKKKVKRKEENICS